MSDEPRLGRLDNSQPYTEAQLATIAESARPFVLGTKDAGKVYCPFCKLREARWRRSLDPKTPRIVDLFVYCTQCHKTGITKLDLDARPVTRFPRSLIVIAIVWAFVVFQLRSPIVTSDGIQYAIDARAGEELWNPHHLLYTGGLAAVFATTRSVIDVDLLDVDLLDWARATSAGWYAVLLIAVSVAAWRRTKERRATALAMFAVASLFGFQWFASQPEPYTASVACASFGFAFASVEAGRRRRASALASGAFLACGALFHQLAVVAGLAMLIEAVLRGREAFRRALGIGAIASVIVVAAYVAAWRADVRGESFDSFLTRYSSQDRAGWGDFANLSVYGLADLGNSLRETFCGFARHSTGTTSGLVTIGLLALVLVGSIVHIGRAPRSHPTATACLVVVILVEVFCWWWIPALAKYQLFAVIPLLVIVRNALEGRFGSTWVIAIERFAMLALVLLNLLFVLVRETYAIHQPRERANVLAETAGTGGVVVCDTESAQFVEWDAPNVGFVPVALALANAGDGTLLRSIGSIYDPLVSAKRIVVPLLELKPNYVGGGFDKTTATESWLSYLAWIFGLRDEPDGTTTRRRFEVLTLKNGEPAIVLDPQRVMTRGPRDIVADLDREFISAFGNPPPFSFERYFENAGSTPR